MKLIHKFTLWYLAITAVVLLAGGVLVFWSVVKENDEEEVRRVRGLIDDAVASLRAGGDGFAMPPAVNVRELPGEAPVVTFHTKDTMGFHSTFQGTERQVIGFQSYRIGDRHLLVSASTFAPEPEETITGVIRSISWMFVALLVIVGVTSVLVSRRILSPFNAGLRAIRSFNLKQEKPPVLPKTGTQEFAALNSFLVAMTTKALRDYKALKEFTENASHELQTPLAIIRGKLELLLESDISDDQAKLIMTAHEAVERLSRTNNALTLLTKLDNQEFPATDDLDFGVRVERIVDSLRELIEMKGLTLKMEIQQPVVLKISADLADILLTNLITNAIRHNIPAGQIHIRLTSRLLTVANTGVAPRIPTDQLFERFRKSDQSGDSTGLGLAIVRRICEVSRFQVEYDFADDRHTLKISF